MLIKSIQVLRAFAAASVVIVHAVNRANTGWPESHGSLTEATVFAAHSGVDLFFVISGFLMAYLHRDHFGVAGAPGKFFSRRIIRIVPFYWLLSAVALGMMVFLPQLADEHRQLSDWGWLAGNFGFFPWPDSRGHADHLLIVGWTLDYELMFYALFAAALFFRRGFVVLCAAMAGLILFGAIVKPAHWALRWVTDLMLLEFLAGVGIAVLMRREWSPPRWLSWLALGAGVVAIVMSAHVDAPRPLKWGVPAAMIVMATLWLRFPCTSAIGRAMTVVGNASYSLYLTQVFSLPALAMLMKIVGVKLPGDLMAAVLWLGACALGVAFWWTVERPMTDVLNRLVAPRPRTPIAEVQTVV